MRKTKIKKGKAQASLELIMIFNFLMLFVLFTFYAGFGIYRQIVAWNINYSTGMTKARTPYGESIPKTLEYELVNGNSGVVSAKNSYGSVGTVGATGGKMFRGYLVKTTVTDTSAGLSGWAGTFANFYSGRPDKVQAAAVYPVSPFLDYFTK